MATTKRETIKAKGRPPTNLSETLRCTWCLHLLYDFVDEARAHKNKSKSLGLFSCRMCDGLTYRSVDLSLSEIPTIVFMEGTTPANFEKDFEKKEKARNSRRRRRARKLKKDQEMEQFVAKSLKKNLEKKATINNNEILTTEMPLDDETDEDVEMIYQMDVLGETYDLSSEMYHCLLALAYDQSPSELAIPEGNPSELDAKGSEETIDVDESAKVALVSQRDVSTTGLISQPTIINDQLLTFGDEGAIFPDLTSRWNRLEAVSWSKDDAPGLFIRTFSLPMDLMKVIRTNPTMLPMQQYAYFRPNLSIRILLNTTRFHQGMLIAGFRYYSGFEKVGEGPENPTNAFDLIQLPHVLINASVNNVGEIEIPYYSYANMLATCNTSVSRLYMATMYIGVLDQLQIVEGSDPTVSMVVMAKLSIGDAHTAFYGLRSKHAVAEFFPFDMLRMVVRGVGSAVGTVTSSPLLSWIPGVTTVGSGVEMASEGLDEVLGAVANAAAGAGALLGPPNGDKPVDPYEKSPVIVWSTPSMSTGRGIGVARPMRLDTRCLTPFKKEFLGGEDQFTASYIKRVWGVHDRLTIKSGMAQGTILTSGPISPVSWSHITESITATGKRVKLTPVGYLSTFYTWWVGDLEMRIMAVKTPMQSFRLRLVTSPDMDITSDNYHDFPGVVFDFQENSEFVSTLPYYGPVPAWPVWENTDYDDCKPVACGKWAIIVENPLIYMGSVPTNVSVFLFMRAAENFKLEVPRPFAGDIPDSKFNTSFWVKNGMSYILHMCPSDEQVQSGKRSYTFDQKNWSSVSSLVEKFFDLGKCYAVALAVKATQVVDIDVSTATLFNFDRELSVETWAGVQCWKVTDKDNSNPLSMIAGSIFILRDIVCKEDSTLVIPEMEERSDEQNKIEVLSAAGVFSSTLQFGETFDIKSVCRRPFPILSSFVNISRGKMFRIKIPVNFNFPGKRTDDAFISLMHGMHDCFRFARGSMNYVITVNSQASLHTIAYHVVQPRNPSYEMSQDFITRVGLNYSQMSVAQEISASGIQQTIPLVVPFYTNVHSLVNGFDISKSSYLGPRVYCNGCLYIDIRSPTSASTEAFIQVYQSMGDDAHMYQFQGVPHTNINTEFVYPELSSKANPEMGEFIIEAVKQVAVPMATSALVARNWKSVTNACTNMENITNRIGTATDAAISAIESLPSKCFDTIRGVFEYILEAGDTMTSMLAHLYSLMRSPTLDLKLAATVGILSLLGIVKMSEYFNIMSILRRLFTTAEPEMQDEDPNGKTVLWVSTILALISGVLGATEKAKKGYAAMASTFFKDFVWSANNISLFLKKNVDMILNYLYTLVGLENPEMAALSYFKEREEEARKWAEEILYLTAGCKADQVLSSKKLQKRVIELYQQSCSYLCSSTKLPAELVKSITFFHTKIVALYDKVGMRIGASKAHEPLCIWMCGDARIGKSSLMKRMCIDLGKECGVVYEGDPFFSISSSAKYWNGWRGQPFILWDDFGQVNHAETVVETLLNFFGIMSCIEFNPAQAALEDKERLVYNDVTMISSNLINPHFPQLTSMDAFNGRIDCKPYITLSSAFREKYPGIEDLADKRLLTQGFFQSEMYMSFEHISLYLLDPRQKVDVRARIIDGTLKPMTYAEFSDKEFGRLKDIHLSRKAKADADSNLAEELSPHAWASRLSELAIDPTIRSVVENRLKEDDGIKSTISSFLSVLGFAPCEPEQEERAGCMNCTEYPELRWCEIMPNSPIQGCVHEHIDGRFIWCEDCERWTGCDDFTDENGEEDFRLCSWGVSCGPLCVFEGRDKNAREAVWDRWLGKFAHARRDVRIPIIITKPEDLRKKGRDKHLTLFERALASIKNGAASIWECMPTLYKVLSVSLNILSSFLTYLVARKVVHSVSNRLFGVTPDDTTDDIVWNFTKWRVNKYLRSQPEIIASGDVNTTTSAIARTTTAASKLCREQMSADLNRILYRNSVYLMVGDGDKTRTIQGKGIAGRVAIFPAHLFHLKNIKTCKVLTFGQSEVGPVIELDYSSLSITRIMDADLVIVGFPKRVPCFRNILNLLPTEKQIPMMGGTHAYLLETPIGERREQCVRIFERVRPVQQNVHYEMSSGRMEVRLLGFEYPYHRQGLCGNVLVDEKHQKVIAMHVCASNDKGMAQVLCKDWFDGYDFEVQDVVEPVMEDSTETNFSVFGDYVPIGKLAEAECAPSPVKTSIRASTSYGLLGEPSRVPITFRTPGEKKPGYALLSKACEVGTKPTRPFPPKILKMATEALKEQVLAKAKPVITATSDRTFKTAIEGLPGVPFMDPMKLATSPGWPLNAEFPGKKKVHFLQLKNESDGNKVLGCHPRFVQLYEEQHKQREGGIIPFAPYYDFLKDERRKPGKQPRLINGCSFSETVEWRRYTLDFWAALQTAGLDVGVAIGLNPRSMDWTRLANKLLKKSSYLLVGDYKNFGPTLDADFIFAVHDIVKAWYDEYCPGHNVSDDMIRRMLFESACQVKHVAGDLCYGTCCGQPSGSPITAPLNTLVNILYFMCIWYEIFEGTPMANMKAFYEFLTVVGYGDDIIVAVDPRIIDKFNNVSISEAFARHGIIYTDAAKDGTLRPYCSIDDATFLKHYFIPHPIRKGVYQAALEKSVIVDIPSWIREPCADELEQIKVSMDCAIRFAYSWGPDYYQEIYDKCAKWLRKRGEPLHSLTWDQIDSSLYDIQRGINQVTEDLFEMYSLVGSPLGVA